MIKATHLGALIAVALVISTGVAAQTPPGPPPADDPKGAPYHVVEQGGDDTRVPLRDYLSSRIDQLRAEMFDRMDERDQRYAQRFDAQQQALNAALQAAKEAVANALSAAKEAVTKAEEASNKRFDSVNEFRQTLSDQAGLFLSKAEGNARLSSLEQSVEKLGSRMDAQANQDAGKNSLWAIIAGLVVLFIAVGGAILNITRSSRPATKA